MQRRTFISSSAAAAGLALSAHAAETGKLKPGDIPQRVLGKTGERLTIIGQAGGRFPMCGYEALDPTQRLPYLCFEPSHSLPGARLHHDRPG